jgi:hypothetical protein
LLLDEIGLCVRKRRLSIEANQESPQLGTSTVFGTRVSLFQNALGTTEGNGAKLEYRVAAERTAIEQKASSAALRRD